MTRIKTKFFSLVLVVIAIFSTGCTQRIADLTLVSTKNIDMTDVHINPRRGSRQKGEDCRIALLGLIPLGLPSLKEAVDRALEKGNGNIMIDQVTSKESIWFVVASNFCIVVEGTVVNSPKAH